MAEIVEGLAETLSAQHAQLRLEKDRIESEMSNLCLTLETVDKRIRLVEDLMREMSIEHDLPKEVSATEAAIDTGTTEQSEPLLCKRNGDILELAYSVLFDRGREPMHYRELTKAVLGLGGRIGGVDPAQTLVSRIAGDERFIRPSKRGCYSLKLYHPKARNIGARKVTTVKRVFSRPQG